jgi:hypothetical protein
MRSLSIRQVRCSLERPSCTHFQQRRIICVYNAEENEPAREPTMLQLLSAEKPGISRLLPDRPKSKEALLSAIDMIFLLPADSDGRLQWFKIGVLPDALRISIIEKSEADYPDVEEPRKEYESMLRLRD